jgi:putative hydrolase of the HAD superfamily
VQRLALFDLDGTLVDRHAAFSDAITGLCAQHHYGADIQHWLLTELADRAHADDFARLCNTFGVREPAGQLWQDYVDRMSAAVTCRPAVLAGLARLRAAGWTTGVVTNGTADIQRAKVAAAGITDLIDSIVVSGDLEIRKPDVRLFQLAAEHCRVDLADGGWMTGDHPAGDIGGGHRAGLRTIWLRGRPWPAGLPAPDHAVDDVTDAIDLLLNHTE